MKKIFCLLLSLSISASMVTGTVYADEDPITEATDKNILLFSSNVSSTNGLVFDLDVLTKTDKSDKNNSVTVKNTFDGSETIGSNKLNYIYFNSEEEDVVSALRVLPEIVSGESSAFEMWAKPKKDSDNERVLIAVSRNSMDNASFYVSFEGDNMNVFANGQKTSIDVSNYFDKWTHFVFERKYADGKVYVNAYINANSVISEEFETEKEDESGKYVFIGTAGAAAAQLNHVFRGNLAETRIYSKFKTDSEVFGLYTDSCEKYSSSEEPQPTPTPIPSDGVILDVDLSEYDGSTATIKDKTGKTVKINGNPQIKAQKGIGKTFTYPYFSGNAGEDISIDGTSFDQISNLDKTSIEFWYQTNIEANKWPKFFSITKGAANAGSWWCETGNEMGGYFSCRHGNKAVFTIGGHTGVAANSEWTHVVLTRELDTENQNVIYKSYVNGSMLGSGVVNDVTALNDSGAMRFGSISGKTDGYIGGFSSIKIYNEILTKEKILELYENEKGMYTAPVFAPADGDISKTAGKVVMKTENGVSAADILNAGITVINTRTGEKLPNASASLTGDDEFTVKLGQYVRYGDSFKISSAYNDTYNYAYVTKGTSSAEVKLYGNNNRVISTVKGQSSIKAMITIANAAQTECEYMYAIIAKAENGAAICAKSGEMSVSANSEEDILETLSDTEDAVNIWLCVWEKSGDALTPIYGMPKTVK